MFCKKCGSQLRDNSKFCHKCGAVIDFAPTVPTETDTDTKVNEVEVPTESPKTPKATKPSKVSQTSKASKVSQSSKPSKPLGSSEISNSQIAPDIYDFITTLPCWKKKFTSAFYISDDTRESVTPLFQVEVLVDERGVFIDKKSLFSWVDAKWEGTEENKKVLTSNDGRFAIFPKLLMVNFRGVEQLQGFIGLDDISPELEAKSNEASTLEFKHKVLLDIFEKSGYDLSDTDELSKPLTLRSKKNNKVIQSDFSIDASSKDIIIDGSVFQKLEDSIVYKKEINERDSQITILFLIPTKTAKNCLFSEIILSEQKEVCLFIVNENGIVLHKDKNYYVIMKPDNSDIDLSVTSKEFSAHLNGNVDGFFGKFTFVGSKRKKNEGAYIHLIYRSNIIDNYKEQIPEYQPSMYFFMGNGIVGLYPEVNEEIEKDGFVDVFYFVSKENLEKICSANDAKFEIINVCQWENSSEFFQICRAFYNTYYGTDKYQAKIAKVEEDIRTDNMWYLSKKGIKKKIKKEIDDILHTILLLDS